MTADSNDLTNDLTSNLIKETDTTKSIDEHGMDSLDGFTSLDDVSVSEHPLIISSMLDQIESKLANIG